MRVADVPPAPRNPKLHNDKGLKQSVKRFGYVEPIVVDERTGFLVAGHGRLDTLTDLQKQGKKPPDGVEVDESGEWLVPVVRGWSSRDDADAEAYLVASNKLVEAGGWDNDMLLEMLEGMGATDLGLLGTGVDTGELHRMLADAERASMARDGAATTSKDKRLHKVDLIYTAAALSSNETSLMANVVLGHCCLAVRSGWHYGVRSGARDRACLACGSWAMHRPMFVDNDYEHYDHDRHRQVVEHWKPKYATVRDIMTPEQCAAAGIDFYETGQILEWAEDLLEAGAENVIIIPKVDVMDQIPEKHVLGYSVPSSYGGTPLPIEAFRGRRVHLLGGSPSLALGYFQKIPDEVVSVDNNSLLRVAQWGVVWAKDGSQGSLSDHGVEMGDVSNPMYVALALSLGHVAQWYRRGEHGAEMDSVPEEVTIRE